MAHLVDKGLLDLFYEILLGRTDLLDIFLKQHYLVRQRIGDLEKTSFMGIRHPAEETQQNLLPGSAVSYLRVPDSLQR